MHPRQADNLLLVEDHSDIAEMLTSYFEGRGFALDYAADGLTGMHLAVKNRYDAIILDLMLPGLDGLSICEKLRHEARDSTPIIMLTARDTLEDKVSGLSSGADDYLVKPFAIAELEARVRSQIRRNRGEVAQEFLRVDELVLDQSTMRVEHRGQRGVCGGVRRGGKGGPDVDRWARHRGVAERRAQEVHVRDLIARELFQQKPIVRFVNVE